MQRSKPVSFRQQLLNAGYTAVGKDKWQVRGRQVTTATLRRWLGV